MRRVVFAWVVLGLVGAGCVPYSTYQETKKKLDHAVDANNDLVKKYNQVLAKLMAKEGVVDPALRADLTRRTEPIMTQRQVGPDFAKEDFERVPEAANEEGGLQLGEALLFNEGEAKLKTDSFRTLDEIVRLLRGKYAGEMVVIEGHTDNQQLDKTRHLYQHNMGLGFERARAVFKYFLDHGIPESRLVISTYSFNKPLDPETASTKEGRRQNRRVVIRRGGTQI